MTEIPFHATHMGYRYYDHTLPELGHRVALELVTLPRIPEDVGDHLEVVEARRVFASGISVDLAVPPILERVNRDFAQL